MPCSTPPTPAASATSTRPAPTDGPRSSSASWLEQRQLGPDDVTVGSKWGYTYTADWQVDAKVHEVKDLSAAHLRRQIDESRELLGNHLRLYQIHSATLDSGVLDDPEVLFELGKLRRERHGDRVHGDRTAPGRDDRAGARGRRVRRRAGDVEPARAIGRSRAGGGPRRGPGRDRQGGARQRPADRRAATFPSWRRSRAQHRPDARRDRARGGAGAAVGGRRAQRRRHRGGAREQPRGASCSSLDRDVLEPLDAIDEDPETYWEKRAELPWN